MSCQSLLQASKYIYPSTRSCAFPSKRGRDSVCLRFGARSMEGETKKVAMEVVKGKEEAAADVSLKQLSKKLDDFAQERDWEKHHSPRNLLLAMVGEVGELSELFMWKGEVPRGLPGWDEAEKEHLGEELSDVLLYLIRLSDMCGVDLGDAALKKIVKNAVKYPAPSKSA